MLEKIYDPQDIERHIYDEWERSGAFKCGLKPEAQPFTIMIPPPNVTGSLHVGHAFDNTIQDILTRFERMRGRDVLWQPGTDHAGIAAQMVVERQLLDRHEPSRHKLGRDAFVERVWAWKRQSGDMIIDQLRRLGASCDWSRQRFTMDEGFARAVREAFVTLYKQKLIDKDKRLVNWDPKFRTAISDIEVKQIETKGHLWHFKYPLKNAPDRFMTVATTRPETMLGDTAIAVHPDDPRYADLIGREAILPLVGREIPIVADAYADPKQGSGAVKITPAHDFNDFEVGRRHGLPIINIFDEKACLTLCKNKDFLSHSPAGEPLETTLELDGLDRFEARDQLVMRMEQEGLLAGIEDHEMTVPYGERSHVVIEPYLTEQWYVDAARLAGPAIAAVESGETTFVPESWRKTYFEWMRNIQPWCISRQLWWGHRIPAWYGPDGEIFVERSEEEALASARRHYGRPVTLDQDEDVLDTWFSSALWPFATLGWPDRTRELKRHYKTDVLVTGFDILFFWVARMMMMGLHFMNEVPFHTVYLHGLVRDERGRKMSKSKGNGVNPLEMIETYGADALRFTIAVMAAQGRDIKISPQRVAGYRNFATKLWNTARFCQMHGCFCPSDFDPSTVSQTLNRWIVGRVNHTIKTVSQALEQYRFNDAANLLYRFTWNVFCDWYLELIKLPLNGDRETVKREMRATAGWAFDRILMVLHPFMPFVTEALWARSGEVESRREAALILVSWPQAEDFNDPQAEAEIGWVTRFLTQVRSLRSEMNIPAGAKLACFVADANPETGALINHWRAEMCRLARLSDIMLSSESPSGAVQSVLDEATISLPITGVVDLSRERKRLEKEIEKLDKKIEKMQSKLNNKEFLSRAPEYIVSEQRENKLSAELVRTKFTAALERINRIL